MVKNIKLNTFFFKEYVKIAEKNTYSAYVPTGNGGIWCIADYMEKMKAGSIKKLKSLEKTKKTENINLAKIGIQKIMEKYFENSDFSMENIKKIMEFSQNKVIFEKTKFQKFYKKEKSFESESLYSQTIIMIDKNNMIVGNSGKTALVIYRKNKILEKISEEEVKKIKLEKNDYLLVGSPEFWKIVNENEFSEIYIDVKSKENIEKNLIEQIEGMEKNLNKVIPFFSIFVEDIEIEKNYELLESEIGEVEKKQERTIKFIFLAIIFIFMLISVKGNILRNQLEKQKTANVENIENIKNDFAKQIVGKVEEKIREKIDFLRNDLVMKVGLEKSGNRWENIECNEEKVLVGNKSGNEKEKENIVENVEIKNRNLENLGKNQNVELKEIKNVEKSSNQEVKKKISKNEKYNRKNASVSNRSFRKKRNLKNDKILQLEKEIEQNWEILGRDKNGNNFGEV